MEVTQAERAGTARFVRSASAWRPGEAPSPLTLAGLHELAQSLRGALQLLHIEQNEKRREEAERVQRRIELAAAAFLIPTLIVGFYGANTWVPGQGQRWGFWAMVLVLVVFTVVGLILVRRWQRQQKQAADRVAEERRELQAQLRTRRT